MTDCLPASTITTVNPSTGLPGESFIANTDAEISAIIESAATAQRAWAAVSPEERSAVLSKAGDVIRFRSEELAAIVTAEMGKPLAESRAEAIKCAGACDYYAHDAERLLAPQAVAVEQGEAWVSFEPLGTILAVMPWNFPLWQTLRFAIPNLLLGNAVLLKSAPNTTGVGLAIARVLQDAGLPEGVFQPIVVTEADTPAKVASIIQSDQVCGVTLTGSTRAGAAVGEVAGRAIKKSVLELGGSDPFVVLSDADIPNVATQAVKARFANAGQSCISPKRFIVDAAVASEFLEHVVKLTKDIRVGDPTASDTQMGPMARSDFVAEVDRQVRDSVQEGAQLLVGGHRIDRSGNFFEPTVVSNVELGMPLYAEEVFGPVAAVIIVDGEAEAIRVANETAYGLGASVWTRDPARGLDVGRQINAGAIFVNEVVASDARLPFGGTRASGYGRELGTFGLHEFANVRSYRIGEDRN